MLVEAVWQSLPRLQQPLRVYDISSFWVELFTGQLLYVGREKMKFEKHDMVEKSAPSTSAIMLFMTTTNLLPQHPSLTKHYIEI